MQQLQSCVFLQALIMASKKKISISWTPEVKEGRHSANVFLHDRISDVQARQAFAEV